ncbi:three-Cys-motif partner protein TcmP [Mesorhizobium opportunistum]|uniref:three-Cys-motif partner protein TcmP n=1 Tax=Mesorhizobium opportunistum TaxID=593909 RepID=UPI0033377699
MRKDYDWGDGAVLEEHSARKLKILREYFYKYLMVRCGLPRQERFRLAIVDGFAGGGRYRCGTSGSPVVFIEELQHAADSLNVLRAAQGASPLVIDCLLILNDAGEEASRLLRENVEPLRAAIRDTEPRLNLEVSYHNRKFEEVYPQIKARLLAAKYTSVLFNVDPCGHSHVGRETIVDIIRSFKSVEIFYTLMINSLLAFLKKADPGRLNRQLAHVDLNTDQLSKLADVMSRKEWLGTGERIVFDAYQSCAPFVSPFSINNPKGWRYWLLHFSSMYRARQVYNNVLHENSTQQAHYGRSGLEMLSYDPRDERRSLYLFDDNGRARARDQLIDDIPRLISNAGDAMTVPDFYEAIYNGTPAHSDDIHAALIESPDIEVITTIGGERRSANAIGIEDVIRLKRQKSFFETFSRNRATRLRVEDAE